MKRTGVAVRAEGWALAGNAVKAHYYNSDDRSLCGKWFLFLSTQPKRPTYEGPKCAGCVRKLARRQQQRGKR